MENALTPPDTPVLKEEKSSSSSKNFRKLTDEEVDALATPSSPSTRKSGVKYSTLPGASTFAVISTEKTNLKFGSVFSLSSLSDSGDKRARKLSLTSVQSEKPKKLFSLLSRKKKTSLSSELVDESDSTGTSESSPQSDSLTKKPSKVNKLLRKLSLSKKPKKLEDLEPEESKDTMEGKNGRGGKKKSSKNKFKKINPGDEGAFTAGSTSDAFVSNEREVRERENSESKTEIISDKSTPLSIPSKFSPPSDQLLAPAQSQDMDSTTDNDEYDTPMGTSPNSPQVMSHVTGENIEGLNATLTNSPSVPAATPESVTPTPEPVPTPATVPSDKILGDIKSPSDLKKEILSITTPIVVEAGRKKQQEHKSSISSSNSSVEKDSPPPNSANTPAVAGKSSNGKEVSPYSKMPEKREYLYKILVIGELGAGKTSIIKRYVHQFFSPHYRATIGVDFALKVLSWDQETIIRLQLWDIAGQERFGNMTRVYYKEAVGAFIVFDVTRVATFDAVLKWKQDLDSKVTLPDGGPIPCVLLANKSDQPKEGIANNRAKIDEFVKENHFSAWFETSAKDNVNIDEAAKSLVTKILENDKVQANGGAAPGETVFSLNRNNQETTNGRNCAC